MIQTDIPLFKQFVLSYLFVIILSMVLTLVVFQNAMEEYERQNRAAARDQLKTQVSLIDSRLQEMEDMAQKLALETDVIQLLGLPADYDTASSYSFRRLYNNISLYPLTNSFIKEFYLYFLKPNVIISSDTIALKVPYYYKNFLAYENRDYHSWHGELSDKVYTREFWPEKTIIREGVESSVITYLQTIPVGRSSGRRALVFILINRNTFYNYLKPLPYLTPASHITITGKEEITSWHPLNETRAPSSHEIVEYQSPFNRWTYRVSYTPGILDSRIGKIRNIFLISELIMFILGVFLAIYYSYRNSLPYFKLYQETEGLKKQHLESFKEGLIKGRFTTEDEINEHMDWADLHFKGDSYQIALLSNSLFSHNSSKGKEDLLLVLVSFIEKIRHLDRENLLLHHSAGKNQIILILKQPEEEKKFWPNLAGLMEEEIEIRKNDTDFEWEMHLLIGQTYGKLINTSLYYEELMHILEYLPPDRLKLVNHRDDFMEESGGCYYPLNQEQRLIQLTKQGNYEQVEQILDHLAQNNSNILNSTQDMEELEREMTGTLFRLARQESSGPQEKEILSRGFILLKKAKQYSTFQSTIREIYRELCDLKWEKKEEENNLLVEKAKAMLKEDYPNPNLCLTLISDRLKVTGKHLSHVFKETSGENFSVCLEKIRMEKARELLSETSHKVVDIPLMVGYSNNNTFYKAFKRYFGVNPSSFR
jgi:two-component system response regulator YesN